MDDSTTVEWLSKAIGQATRSAKFCVAGRLPALDPGIEVQRLGKIRLPLKRTPAKELVAACRAAPYGKGTRTLVDKRVRNTFELDPKKFSLSDAWNAAIAAAMRPVAEQLGLPAERLEARLYKLLVYLKGGFFLPHRDSEKHDRMVASMIVALPNRFEGGTLVVRHGARKQTLTFDEAATGNAPCYAAFYADCEHEVQRVTGGVRLCLAYNLVLKPKRSNSLAAKPVAPPDALAESIGSWVASQPAKPLVFALEHHYTARGLALDLLKGADRRLADLVVAAAERTDCLSHLAQVSRHLSQFADDGSFERDYSRRRYAPRRAIEIGETYEDELSGSEWTSVGGKKQPWGDIAFDLSAIVSSLPIDDWKPTSEEFEGYTGNAGNTLDRWYHRSAIVVWRRAHHFDVVAGSGAAESISLFCSMAAKLARTPRKRFEEARADCVRFARAIISRWPSTVGYAHRAPRRESPHDRFQKHLPALRDRETIAMFLTTLAEHDQSLQLSSFVVAACREFGWSAFAQEMKRLISARPNKHRPHEIAFRDVEWLSAFCCDKAADPDKSALADALCATAVERFCEPRPPKPAYYEPYHRREASVSETALPLLLKALAASGRDEGLSRVIQFVRESSHEFSLDKSQVPCLKALLPWSQRQLGLVHPQLASWLASVRRELESATASRPVPPTDWARPADVACGCRYCTQLKALLTDPTSEVGRIPAREEDRQHLIGMIDRHRCDVKHALERKGSPYSLLLTKTNGAFERAVKRFEADRRLLSELPVAG
ncbi:MAG TPA: 2OG-Fe(II) oxygenase [Pirellulales bacterium]|nr:2OG-Fe(II) oxygenase [Pirellulales bacterium]